MSKENEGKYLSVASIAARLNKEYKMNDLVIKSDIKP